MVVFLLGYIFLCAGGGSRTRDTSLENWSFTVKLRPQFFLKNLHIIHKKVINKSSTYLLKFLLVLSLHQNYLLSLLFFGVQNYIFHSDK